MKLPMPNKVKGGLLIMLLSCCLLLGCVSVEAPAAIPEPTMAPVEQGTNVTVEVSAPRPIDAVLMLSSVGHWWKKIPGEDWELVFVWCDAKNFLPYAVHLDSAVVEINGQSEEAPIDVTLGTQLGDRYNGQILIYTKTVERVPSGDYPMRVVLKSEGTVMCERTDIISITCREED